MSADHTLRERLEEVLHSAASLIDGSMTVADKDDSGLDLVTSKDLEIQQFLEASLPEILPGSTVAGEEGFQESVIANLKSPVWLVDPIDGTVNFANGLPIFAISIALLSEGKAVLAGVLDVRHAMLFSAVRGKGAWLNGKKLEPENRQSRLVGMSSGLVSDLAANAPETLANLLCRYKLRNLGSQALQLCYAAAGFLRWTASREAKGWDDLAGALIARESGLDYGFYGPRANGIGEDQHSLCAPKSEFEELRQDLEKSRLP
jgi:myo-inositol-1(or 4)-monophosphatase